MTDFIEGISNSFSPVAQAVRDLTTVAGAHPIPTFMAFALASVFVLNRSGSAR